MEQEKSFSERLDEESSIWLTLRWDHQVNIARQVVNELLRDNMHPIAVFQLGEVFHQFRRTPGMFRVFVGDSARVTGLPQDMILSLLTQSREGYIAELDDDGLGKFQPFLQLGHTMQSAWLNTVAQQVFEKFPGEVKLADVLAARVTWEWPDRDTVFYAVAADIIHWFGWYYAAPEIHKEIKEQLLVWIGSGSWRQMPEGLVDVINKIKAMVKEAENGNE